MAGQHRPGQGNQRSHQRARGAHRRKPERIEPYRWLGAGAITLGIGAVLASGSGVAHADTGSSAPAHKHPISDSGTPAHTTSPAVTTTGHSSTPPAGPTPLAAAITPQKTTDSAPRSGSTPHTGRHAKTDSLKPDSIGSPASTATSATASSPAKTSAIAPVGTAAAQSPHQPAPATTEGLTVDATATAAPGHSTAMPTAAVTTTPALVATATANPGTPGTPGTSVAGVVLAAAVRRTLDNTPTAATGHSIGQTHTPTALAATRAAGATPASATITTPDSVSLAITTQLNNFVAAVHAALVQTQDSIHSALIQISSSISTPLGNVFWNDFLPGVVSALQHAEYAILYVTKGPGAANSYWYDVTHPKAWPPGFPIFW